MADFYDRDSRLGFSRAEGKLGYTSLVLMIVAFCVTAPMASAQTGRARASCTDCSLELVRVARLGAESDPELLGSLLHVAVDSRGNIAAENSTGDGVLIFDRTGRYQRRVGRRGSGPGELSSMFDVMFGPGDSLWVMNGPFSLVYSPAFAFVRSSRRVAEQWGTAVPLSDGTLVSASMTGIDASHLIFLSQDATKKPLLIDEGREAYHPPGQRFPICSACLVPLLAAGRESNSFWSLNPNSYRVRQWSSRGVATTDFVVRTPRFPVFRDDDRGDPAVQRLRPQIHSLGVALDGVLLVAGETSSTSWKQNPQRAGLAGTARRKGGVQSRDDSAAVEIDRRNRATVVQVLDPRTGRILGERQFDGRHLKIVRHLAFENGTDSDGFVHIDVWQVQLKDRGK